MKQGTFLIALFLFAMGAKAQVQHSGWLASFNNFRINKQFSFYFDAQLRSTDRLEQVGTVLLRPGLNYHLNKTVTFTLGYAAVFGRRNLGGLSALLTEHRIWQQAMLNHKISTIALTHRFRFEERYLPQAKIVSDELKNERHEQAYRFRYFVRGLIPLPRGTSFTKGPYLALQNEVFLNTGDKTAVSGKTFDQNRLYGGIGYRLKGKMDIEAGYMNQYTVTRTAFVNNHILQLAFFKRL